MSMEKLLMLVIHDDIHTQHQRQMVIAKKF